DGGSARMGREAGWLGVAGTRHWPRRNDPRADGSCSPS
ncbi:hypothetical protein, partial [Mesorhizobium sp.]